MKSKVHQKKNLISPDKEIRSYRTRHLQMATFTALGFVLCGDYTAALHEQDIAVKNPIAFVLDEHTRAREKQHYGACLPHLKLRLAVTSTLDVKCRRIRFSAVPVAFPHGFAHGLGLKLALPAHDARNIMGKGEGQRRGRA